MSDSKLTQLVEASTINSLDDMYLVQGGVSKKVKGSILKDPSNINTRTTGTGVTPVNLDKILTMSMSNGVFGELPLITDNLDGSLTVADCQVMIRDLPSPTADLYKADVTGDTFVITPSTVVFLYIEWNAGEPQYVIDTTRETITNVPVAHISREAGTHLHINRYRGRRLNDNHARTAARLIQTQPFARVAGGVISEVGVRNIKLTEGSWWECTNPFTTDAVDTSVAGDFTYIYRDGAGGYTRVEGSTQVSNLLYDDGTGVLATLANNQFSVNWVYLETDGHVNVIYGRDTYTLPEAEVVSPPADIPNSMEVGHRLIGKIVIEKSAVAFESIETTFDTRFDTSPANSHEGLVDLQGGVVGEHYHLTAEEYTDIVKAPSVAGIAQSKLLSGEVAIIGSNVNITDGKLMFSNGYDANGAVNTIESNVGTELVNPTWIAGKANYVKKIEGGGYVATAREPIFGKVDGFSDFYMNGKWYEKYNLVDNGDFSDGTVLGWSQGTDPILLSVSNGKLKGANTTATFGDAQYTTTCIIGEVYRITSTLSIDSSDSNSVSANMYIASGGAGSFSGEGEKELIFEATATSVVFNCSPTTSVIGNYFLVGNIQVTPIALPEDVIEYTTPITYLDNIIHVDPNGNPYDVEDYSYPELVVDKLVADRIDLDNIAINNLPTVDPYILGEIWNNSNVLTVSTGV